MASLQCAHAPSAARLFLQLSARPRPPAAAAPALSILDVLLPPQTIRRLRPAPPQAARPRHGIGKAAALLRKPLDGAPAAQQRRGFASTGSLQHTRAIYNPQRDDNGQEMMLELTPRAAKRLDDIMAKDKNPQLALRVQVESGGCHGFQYLMSLVTLPPALPEPVGAAEEGSVIREDDTIFAYAADEQQAAGLAAPKIILDQPSLELLKGSKVDFTMELIGSQFKIVDNPLATSSCGCGTSFDIKI